MHRTTGLSSFYLHRSSGAPMRCEVGMVRNTITLVEIARALRAAKEQQ